MWKEPPLLPSEYWRRSLALAESQCSNISQEVKQPLKSSVSSPALDEYPQYLILPYLQHEAHTCQLLCQNIRGSFQKKSWPPSDFPKSLRSVSSLGRNGWIKGHLIVRAACKLTAFSHYAQVPSLVRYDQDTYGVILSGLKHHLTSSVGVLETRESADGYSLKFIRCIAGLGLC